MRFLDISRFIGKILTLLPPILYDRVRRSLSAQLQKWRYRPVPDPKVILVVGGSFAGIELVRRLIETIPTGYTVVLVEKNSHFHWSFAFPRVTVSPGQQGSVFIPYDGIARSAPAGIYKRIQSTVTEVQVEADASGKERDKHVVLLSSGEKVEWDILAIATGSSSGIPSKLHQTEKQRNCEEFEGIQRGIVDAKTIAVIGGGAVGVELASDIKTFYPDKKVTLVHSHKRLLNRFGERLSTHALEVLKEIGVTVVLGERPVQDKGSDGHALIYPDGHRETFDLMFPCVGQSPNSSLLSSLAPTAVNPDNKRILVDRHLRVIDETSKPLHGIFALGDVADHGGPLMGRAGYVQSGIVAKNILATIRKGDQSQSGLETYVPHVDFEGAIGLTLGRGRITQYMMDGKGGEIMLPSHRKNVKPKKDELNMARMWKMFGETLEI